MLNNYDETVKRLATFVIENMPAGAERERDRLIYNLGHEQSRGDIALEFRPTQDVSCTLYIRTEGPEGKYGNTRIEDAEGNLWYAFVVKCEVSWPSFGADNLLITQRRLALMTEVTRFACDVEREFAEVFHHLSQTKADRDAMEIRNVKARVTAEIERLVRTHAKGMKVGDTKLVGIDPKFDTTGVGEVQVERKEGGRTFKYSASLECPGLVYFMRLEA